MEILLYLLPAAAGITLWIVVKELSERKLDKKNDEVSRIKKASRMIHSHEDHNTQFRQPSVSTTVLWKKKEIDPIEEDRMRQRIRTQIKDK